MKRVTGTAGRRAVVLSVVELIAAGPLAGQSVRVRAIDAATARPVAGAIVRLVDTANQSVAQGLTTESGRLVLRAPLAGRYRLRADRIGHAGTSSEPFDLRDTLTVEVVMPAERVMLPELAVKGSTSCAVRADGPATASLWEEIRKALAAGQITSATQSVELSVRRYRKYRTTAGILQADSTLREHRTRASPFVSPAPAVLAVHGYIREAPGGGFQFHAPDVTTLMSAGFLETHCFELARPAAEAPTLVGLAFRPTKEIKRPDVRGVLWVERATAELHHLEFQFVNAPDPVDVPGIGGRIDFARLKNGAWIVTDWYIRAPDRMVIERQQRARLTRRDSLAGYLDEGGTARPVGDPTVALGEAVGQVGVKTAVSGDLRGRVVTAERAPIAGATVAIAETDTVLVTDADGRFEIPGVGTGRYRVRIRAVGFQPIGASVGLSEGRRLVDTTFIMERAAQLLDSVVVTAKAPAFASGKMADVERRRRDGFGKFLTREVLHDPLQGGLDIQLRRFARIRMVPRCRGYGYAPATTFLEAPLHHRVVCPEPRREMTDCFMTVYLDGALYWSNDMGRWSEPPDFSKFNALDFEAVEVYRGAAELPIEYAGSQAYCGVVLLWTRVG